jgi:hypothetical protein
MAYKHLQRIQAFLAAILAVGKIGKLLRKAIWRKHLGDSRFYFAIGAPIAIWGIGIKN